MLTIVVRCPRCLLTVYTHVLNYDGHVFTSMSLADEDLPFYNCPMAFCEYHVRPDPAINLYRNSTAGQNMLTSPGIRVVPRTRDTRPFRTPAQVSALAITLGPTEDELAGTPVKGSQANGKAQNTEEQPATEHTTMEHNAVEHAAVEDTAMEDTAVEHTAIEHTAVEHAATEPQFVLKNGTQVHENGNQVHENGNQVHENGTQVHENGHQVHQNGHQVHQNGTAAPAATETQTTIPSGTKWTDAEVEKLKGLSGQGLTQSVIASKMNRTLLSVRYKLSQIRELEKLPKGQT